MTDENKAIFIFKVKQKMDSSGSVIEKEQLTVQGENLSECRKHFDEIWDKENE